MSRRVLSCSVRIWAILQIYAAGLWIIGPFGIGAGGLSRTLLPDWLSQPLSYGLQGLTVGPITGVLLTSRQAASQVGTLSLHLSGNSATTITPNGATFGDINLNATAQFSTLSTGQGWAWVLIHVVPLITMAVLWWLLANAISQSAGSTTFTVANARLLAVAGAVIAVGSTVLSLLIRWFYTWAAQSSQLASRIRIPDYSWHSIPWPAVVAGAALIALGQVWHRGVAVEAELGGLV